MVRTHDPVQPAKRQASLRAGTRGVEVGDASVGGASAGGVAVEAASPSACSKPEDIE